MFAAIKALMTKQNRNTKQNKQTVCIFAYN